MAEEAIACRLDSSRTAKLGEIAATTGRDIETTLTEAVDAYSRYKNPLKI